MARWIRIFILLLVVSATAFSHGVSAQQESGDTPPGVTIETIARGPSRSPGEDLVLVRMTLAADAFISPGLQPTVTLLSVETGSAALSLLVGEAVVTRQGVASPEQVSAGAYVTLDTGDSAAFDSGTRLSIDNPAEAEATYLIAALAPSSQPLFAGNPAGSLSVETYACSVGMTIATLEPAACSVTTAPLVQWQLQSDAFNTALGAGDAKVAGATTTWEGLPEGAYFVDLTAQSFAPGYVDYFIPSSNQVTRQYWRVCLCGRGAVGRALAPNRQHTHQSA
jgi:hypothetical protein